MKNLYVILGASLVLCGLGYILLRKEKECDCCCVEEKEIENNEEEIIKDSVISSLRDFNNPSDLVGRVINEAMKNSRGDFSILNKVPKNIEELEEYMKKEGLYEKYEKTLEEKYIKNMRKD